MTLYAFDAAYGAMVNLALARAQHPIAFNYYIAGQYASTSLPPQMARANGWGSLATYERLPGELVGMSRIGGQSLGTYLLDAMEAAGYPLDGTVALYPSVDEELPAIEAGSTDAGLTGIRDKTRGRLSLREYGEGVLLEHVYAAQLVDGPGWLMASTSFPGFAHASTSAAVCMVQQVGSPVPNTDINVVTQPYALGAYWPDGSPYQPSIGDDEMKAYLLEDGAGNAWVVAYDFRHRHLVSPALFAGLQATSNYLPPPAGFNETELSHVPILQMSLPITVTIDAAPIATEIATATAGHVVSGIGAALAPAAKA